MGNSAQPGPVLDQREARHMVVYVNDMENWLISVVMSTSTRLSLRCTAGEVRRSADGFRWVRVVAEAPVTSTGRPPHPASHPYYFTVTPTPSKFGSRCCIGVACYS
jgi:hypothetical protein